MSIVSVSRLLKGRSSKRMDALACTPRHAHVTAVQVPLTRRAPAPAQRSLMHSKTPQDRKMQRSTLLPCAATSVTHSLADAHMSCYSDQKGVTKVERKGAREGGPTSPRKGPATAATGKTSQSSCTFLL